MDDNAFQKALPMLKPDMTQKAVRELVKELNPRPAPTATDAETAIVRKLDRLYKQFQELPQRQQSVFGELAGLTEPPPDARSVIDRLVVSAPTEAAALYRDLGRALPDAVLDLIDAAKEAFINLTEDEAALFRSWMEAAR